METARGATFTVQAAKHVVGEETRNTRAGGRRGCVEDEPEQQRGQCWMLDSDVDVTSRSGGVAVRNMLVASTMSHLALKRREGKYIASIYVEVTIVERMYLVRYKWRPPSHFEAATIPYSTQ